MYTPTKSSPNINHKQRTACWLAKERAYVHLNHFPRSRPRQLTRSMFNYKTSGSFLIILPSLLLLSQSHSSFAQNDKISQPNSHVSTNDNISKKPSSVDDILAETFLSIDALDEKIATVGNKTPNALMRDNLRSLDSWDPEILNSRETEGRLNDDLSSLLQPRDHKSTQMIDDATEIVEAKVPPNVKISAGEASRVIVGNKRPAINAGDNDDDSDEDDESDGQAGTLGVSLKKSARQLMGDLQQFGSGSDYTEKHIKFTLDLMQSIFASQSYTSKTNLIESFLISPLSIQMVLMMMHLGARGQTRRELNNCLHFGANSQQSGVNLPFESPDSSYLKRRIYRHQPPVVGSGVDVKPSIGGTHARPSSSSTTSTSPTANQISQQQNDYGAHEFFGASMRNLFKDPSVLRALTSANQIFLQKNLPLSAQYEWAIKHYYSADVKLVDFQHQTSPTAMRSSPATSWSSHASPSSPSDNNKQKQVDHSTFSSSSSTINGGSSGSSSSSSSSSSSNNNNNNSLTPGSPLSPSLSPTLSNLTVPSFLPVSPSSPQASETHHQVARDETCNVQQVINEWVEKQSKGKISHFLTSPVSTSTLMMAINVLYFKGDWQYKFDPADTETDAYFTLVNGKTTKIPMMVNRLPLAFAHDTHLKASVIELPYKAQRLGLFLILPDETSGIFHTMQMLNSTSFANMVSAMRKPSPSAEQGANGINVRIPKFSIESSPRLSHILSQQLGLKSLFSPDLADLSGMFAGSQQQPTYQRRSTATSTGNWNVSSVDSSPNQPSLPPQVGLDELLHKAILQVNEQGSVAAASSATIVERVGLFNSNYFEADHPFLLFLMDKQTGLVLFSGVFAGNNNNNNNNNRGNGNNLSSEA